MAADEQERKKWLWILTLSAEPYIIIYYYGEFDQMPWRKMIKKKHTLFVYGVIDDSGGTSMRISVRAQAHKHDSSMWYKLHFCLWCSCIFIPQWASIIATVSRNIDGYLLTNKSSMRKGPGDACGVSRMLCAPNFPWNICLHFSEFTFVNIISLCIFIAFNVLHFLIFRYVFFVHRKGVQSVDTTRWIPLDT